MKFFVSIKQGQTQFTTAKYVSLEIKIANAKVACFFVLKKHIPVLCEVAIAVFFFYLSMLLNRIFVEIQIAKQRTMHSNIYNNTNKNFLKSVRITVGLLTDNKKVLFGGRKMPGLIDNIFGTNCSRLH